ncbi:MAG: WG repeat-containing protein, partial [Bacteroidia bacterium]|nr:WG repeat-containing protein [Bacteroidia bacterium]
MNGRTIAAFCMAATAAIRVHGQSPLAPARLNGFFGFIDTTGKEVIPHRLLLGRLTFREGMTDVRDVHHRWGFITAMGMEAVPPQFDDVEFFSEGLCVVKKEGEYGYIDKNGRFAFEAFYRGAGPFCEGLAAVFDGKAWGFIDKSGKQVVDFFFEDALYFSEGAAPVKKGGKWSAIDRSGRPVAPFDFEEFYPFR